LGKWLENCPIPLMAKLLAAGDSGKREREEGRGKRWEGREIFFKPLLSKF
jgi:hypothetical protein